MALMSVAMESMKGNIYCTVRFQKPFQNQKDYSCSIYGKFDPKHIKAYTSQLTVFEFSAVFE